MKVLIVCANRFDNNGIVSVIMNYYKAMDKTDIKFDFVVINDIDDNTKKLMKDNNSKLFILRRKRVFSYIYKLKNICKKGGYDIVHVHGNSATMSIELLASKLAKVRLRIAHTHNSTCNHKIIDKMLRPLLKLTCNCRFACGKKAGKWLYKDKEFTIINNGTDIYKFAYNKKVRKEYRKKLDIKDDEILLGHVGAFNYQKNHELLIDILYEMVKDNKNVKLLMIGDGPLHDEIKEKVVNMHLEKNVVFVKQTNIVEDYMQAIDVLVMPSRFEGFPMVLVEAMSANLVCVVSSNISKEVDIVGLVKFVEDNDNVEDSVDDNKEEKEHKKSNKNSVSISRKDICLEYKKKILDSFSYDREKTASKITSKIKEQGYNMEDNAKNLKRIYEDRLGKI